MDRTGLPLRGNDYTGSTSSMVTLPSIRELGLWRSGQAGRSPSVGQQSVGHSRSSTPLGIDTHRQRHFNTEKCERSPEFSADQTFGYFPYSSNPEKGKHTSSHWGTHSQRQRVSTLEPPVEIQTQDAFEKYRSSSNRRRGSADSISSTPSLVGSFTSSCSDNTPPASTPGTPHEFHNSAYLWDPNPKENLQVPAPDYDSRWSKTYHQESSRTHRRNYSTTKSCNVSRGSQQPAYKVQRRERARPKNISGQAHCNEKYTDEENRFLIYFRVDHPLSWQQLEAEYNRRFPEGTRPYRTDGGLQSQFYRQNTVCPEMTDDKLLVFGPTEEHEAQIKEAHETKDKTLMLSFNEYDNMTFDCKVRLGGKVSLIDRYAEQIAECDYPWMTEQDKTEARRLAALRHPYRLAWEARKASKQNNTSSQSQC